MERVPEASAVTDLDLWIAYERDAVWTAKLAVLRARRREDIAHFGACLREHDRHAGELELLARLVDPAREACTEPAFATREAFVVGAIDDGLALLDAMEGIEAARVTRYERRQRTVGRGPAALVDGVLERHLADARARLASLRRLRVGRQEAAA